MSRKNENLDDVVSFKFKVLTTKSHQISNEDGEGQCLIDQSSYTNSNYTENFLSQLRLFYDQKQFCDIELTCENSNLTISCHKLVLASFSPYFEAMFSSNLIETKTNKVKMKSTDYETLKEIIGYAYTGSLNLNPTNVQSVFALASLLQVKDVVNACSDYIESQLDMENSLDIYYFSKHHSCKYLMDKSQDFICRNFTEISRKTEFFEFSDVDSLCDLLSQDDLDVTSEEFLLNAIVDWIKFDYERRKVFLESIFDKCVRINLLEKDFLREFFVKHQKIFAKNNIENMIQIHLTNTDPSTQIMHRIRAGMTKVQYCFVLIGGNCDLDDGFYVNCFNPFNGEKFFLSRSFLEKSKFSSKGYFHVENPGICLNENNRIFVAGGNLVYHEYKIYNSVDRQYKGKILHKKNEASSSKSDKYHKDVVSLSDDRDSLKDGEEILSKELYEYDNNHDTWIRRSNMLFAKANFTLCAMDDKIYSFGGITKNQDQFDIVECYDSIENKWHYECSMPAPFVAGCVVRHEDAFYVMGGRSGVGRFNNCYMFRPKTREWTEISKMLVGRFNFGACILNNKIYVFGGQRYNESEQNYYTREALDSVEMFDLNTREWSMVTQMPSPLYNTGVCVYDDDFKCVYVCGTTECKYKTNTLIGFIFTSVFRLEILNDLNNETKYKWTVVEHDVSEIKSNYRCLAAKLNTKKIHKCHTDILINK